ncbi:MAG TPA: multidrug effflux MFS transporter [Burkholderiaceae bacterium]|jgi:DHA1 family bicyclomycin/chloramphenicol resistance-like MFS transporter
MTRDPIAIDAARQVPKVPLWLLALFTFSGTLAMHVFVPALPYAAEGLSASAASVQLTISVYIAGLAVGQLIYGPVSDRFGRRPTLMVGLGLYTVAGLAAALAPDVHSLVAARLFQALGGCAGLVLGRAIVRDTAATSEAARRLALMNLMVTIGPGLAPILGAALAETLGWRSILYALCGLGVVNFFFTWRLLPETGAADARANASVAKLAHNYLSLLKSPAFLGYAIGGGCSTTAMYGFIAAAPFIFVHQLHRPAHEVGVCLALLVSGVWIGSMLASRLVRVVALSTLLKRGNALSVASACVLLAAALTNHLSVALVIGSMFVLTLGAGLASPVALTQAISVNPLVTGSASGLYGFVQMGVGALCTALASLGDNPALTVAIVLTSAGLVATLAYAIASKRR